MNVSIPLFQQKLARECKFQSAFVFLVRWINDISSILKYAQFATYQETIMETATSTICTHRLVLVNMITNMTQTFDMK